MKPADQNDEGGEEERHTPTHERKAASGSAKDSTRSTTVARTLPSGAPTCDGNWPRNPRLSVGALLGDEQDGAAPLASDRDGLHEAEHHEDDRCRITDLVETRDRADQEGRDTDDQKRDLQQLLAAELVAVVSEDDATDRTGDEAIA